ncbi:beta strand repeat-containing protein [Tabrizicola sp.]|uniref:beta strand repeat-containing protein n=1 Tax=Tabrizicola sp. TaxID=2005166 RepID=UPI003D2D1088
MRHWILDVSLKRLGAFAIFVGLSSSPALAEQTVSVSFPLGGVIGTVGTNTGQANSIVNTANVGITSVTFSQTNNGTDGRFGGTQGNDYCGTLTLSGTTTFSFAACVNWRITTGNTADYIGFVPASTANNAPVGTPITLDYSGSFASFSGGYNVIISSALNNAAPESNFAFRTNNTTATVYNDGVNINGNAAASSALAALNAFAGVADTTAPTITGPDGNVTTTGAASNISLNEGGTAVYSFTANEPVTWSISGTDAGDFTIDPVTGVLTFNAPTDYSAPVDSDGNNVYVLTIRAVDGAGNVTNQTLTVTVLEVGDTTAPIVTASQTLTYTENQTADSVIGTVLATDAVGVTGFRFTDTGTTTSLDGYYTIASDGQVTITAAGVAAGVANNDFETGANSFTYAIQAGDAAGNWSLSVSVAFAVTNLNDTAPVFAEASGFGGTFANGAYAFTYNEGATGTTLLGKVAATDADGGTLTFSLTDPNFEIDPTTGEITLTTAGVTSLANDFETGPNSHTVTVTVFDGVNTQTVQVVLNEANVNDTAPVFAEASGFGGTFANGAYAFTYNEGATGTTLLGKVAATDADGGTLTFSLTDPNFEIDPTTGEITLTTAGVTSLANDFETGPNSHTVTVTVFDGVNTQTVQVVLNEANVNDTAPVFAEASGFGGTFANGAYAFTYNEGATGTTLLGKVAATDADGSTLTFSLTDPNFEIDPTTGEITLTTAGVTSLANDFETGPNSHTVTVTVFDGVNTQTVQVVLNEANVNDTAPVFAEASGFGGTFANGAYAFTYNEGATGTTLLGKVAATDADGGTLTFSLTDPNFEIDPTTGEITLTTAGVTSLANDFETGPNSHTVTVTVFDGVNTQTVQVVLNEANVNDTAPVFAEASGFGGTFANGAYAFTYNEGATGTTLLGKVAATDADGSTLTFSLTDPNFEIDPTTGEITLTTAGVTSLANDFETGPNSHTVTVTVFDGVNTQTVQVVLNEANVNDTAPVFAEASGFGGTFANGAYAFTYNEGATGTTLLGKVAATDADGSTLTFSLTDPNFEIDPTTGEITLTTAGVTSLANDFETGPNSHTVTVTVFDGVNTQTVQVVLNEFDIDDTAPVLTPPSGLNVAEDGAIELQAGIALVGALSANEGIQNWNIVETGPDHARFQLVDGVLSFKQAPAFDPAPGADNTYEVTIEAYDLAGNRSTLTLTIRIVDSAAAALARSRSDIEQVILDTEIAKLRGQQNSLRAMTSSARDRLAGAGGCGSAEEDAAVTAMEDDESCRDFEETNLDVDANSDLVTVSAMNSSVKTFNGVRRIVNLNLGVSDGDNISTLSFSGYAALENFRAENALYGLFVGLNVNQNDVSRGMGGSVDSYGLSVGAYAVHEFAKGLFSEAYLSLGRSQNQLDLTDGYLDVAADYGTTEAHLGWIVSGVYERGNFDIWPEMGIQVSQSRSSSIEVDGSIPGDASTTVWNGLTATLSRANVSTDIRYYLNERAADSWIVNFKPGLVCERVDAVATRSGCGLSGAIGLNQSSLDGSRRFSAQIAAEEIEEITRSSASVMYELRF